jgi:hypothetical protein
MRQLIEVSRHKKEKKRDRYSLEDLRGAKWSNK